MALPADCDFAACRFIEAEGCPVLYVYEIQLEAQCQGKGLGNFLMKMMELVAFRFQMQSVMLTVMQENAHARKMYSALGYTQHPSSPSLNAHDDSGYLILHKPVPIRRTKQ